MIAFKNVILLLLILSSCSNGSMKENDIDGFISKFKNENFNNLKGISIFQRSKGVNEIVYAVGRYGENKPLYFVEFNTSQKRIKNISRSLLIQNSIPDYLTDNEITNAVNEIRKYDFYLLSVDSSENVFINPYRPNEPAYYLRLSENISDSIVRKGYVFNHYKDNWYINDKN